MGHSGSTHIKSRCSSLHLKEGKLIAHFKKTNPLVLFLLLNKARKDNVAEMERKDKN